MAANYLLGYGERLMKPLPPVPINPKDKAVYYPFAKAKERTVAKLKAISGPIAALDEKFRPAGEAVALVTLHPAFLAKTYFPSHLFAECRLRSVGSRPTFEKPEAPRLSAKGKPELSSQFFVAGKSSQMARLHDIVGQWQETSPAANDLCKVEDIRLPDYAGKIRLADYQDERCTYWEVVLHAGPSDTV